LSGIQIATVLAFSFVQKIDANFDKPALIASLSPVMWQSSGINDIVNGFSDSGRFG
jgi:hypothetical protein